MTSENLLRGDDAAPSRPPSRPLAFRLPTCFAARSSCCSSRSARRPPPPPRCSAWTRTRSSPPSRRVRSSPWRSSRRGARTARGWSRSGAPRPRSSRRGAGTSRSPRWTPPPATRTPRSPRATTCAVSRASASSATAIREAPRSTWARARRTGWWRRSRGSRRKPRRSYTRYATRRRSSTPNRWSCWAFSMAKETSRSRARSAPRRAPLPTIPTRRMTSRCPSASSRARRWCPRRMLFWGTH